MNIDTQFFQKLSPSMQHMLSVVLGAGTACLLIGTLAIRPQQLNIRQLERTSNTLRQTLGAMRSDIAGTEALKAQTAAAVAERDAILASGVIDPLLGSFAMRGKALLEPVALETGFQIDNVRELPLLPLQLPKPAPEQTYGRQQVEFSGRGSYEQIASFIAKAEAAQPLATLSSLKILSQLMTPELHKAIITFEWPAKGEKRKPVPPSKTKAASK